MGLESSKSTVEEPKTKNMKTNATGSIHMSSFLCFCLSSSGDMSVWSACLLACCWKVSSLLSPVSMPICLALSETDTILILSRVAWRSISWASASVIALFSHTRDCMWVSSACTLTVGQTCSIRIGAWVVDNSRAHSTLGQGGEREREKDTHTHTHTHTHTKHT